jgi:hypothetical protein
VYCLYNWKSSREISFYLQMIWWTFFNLEMFLHSMLLLQQHTNFIREHSPGKITLESSYVQKWTKTTEKRFHEQSYSYVKKKIWINRLIINNCPRILYIIFLIVVIHIMYKYMFKSIFESPIKSVRKNNIIIKFLIFACRHV